MRLSSIHLGGNAGAISGGSNLGDEVRQRISAFLRDVRPSPGSTTRLAVDFGTLHVFQRQGTLWSFHFMADTSDAQGAPLGRRRFDGTYDLSQGGIGALTPALRNGER